MSRQLRSMSVSSAEALARECEAYCQHLNSTLSLYCGASPSMEEKSYSQTTKKGVISYLPLVPENLLEKLRDGVLFAYILNDAFPGCIDPESLVHDLDLTQMDKEHSKVTFEVHGNLTAVLRAAKEVRGLVIVNLGPHDILDGRQDLVLGLLWQIFNTRLTRAISLAATPEILQLANPGESISEVAALRPEAILIRWVNRHLQRTNFHRRITNLGRDLADSEVYAHLLRALAPESISISDVDEVCNVNDSAVRAEKVLGLAERINCRQFVAAQDICSGHARLNFAFCGTIFNARSGLYTPSQVELDQVNEKLSEMTMRVDDTENFNKKLQSEINSLRIELAASIESKKIMREDLSAEYAAATADAVDQERRRHQEEIWNILAKQDSARQHLFDILRLLSSAPMIEADEAAHSSQLAASTIRASANSQESLAATPDALESVIRVLYEVSTCVVDRLHDVCEKSKSLATAVKHKEKVNEMMGEKIREYTELVIGDEKRAKQVAAEKKERRSSILKRIFHN